MLFGFDVCIMEKLNRHKQIKVTSLAKELYVSEMTIRRDLAMMEAEGFLTHFHGGAVQIGNALQYPTKVRMSVQGPEKKLLALQAKKHLQDGQVIFFNSSSTCAYMIPYPKKHKDITVVTNSTYLLSLLAAQRIPCLITGGSYRLIEDCLVGRYAEDFLRNINTDVVFLSCEGLSDEGMLTESDPELAAISKIALQNTKKRGVLMDKSKLGKIHTHNVCHKDQLHELILA